MIKNTVVITSIISHVFLQVETWLGMMIDSLYEGEAALETEGPFVACSSRPRPPPPHPEACFESALTLKQRLFAFEVELNSFQLREMAVLWVQVGVAVGPRM